MLDIFLLSPHTEASVRASLRERCTLTWLDSIAILVRNMASYNLACAHAVCNYLHIFQLKRNICHLPPQLWSSSSIQLFILRILPIHLALNHQRTLDVVSLFFFFIHSIALFASEPEYFCFFTASSKIEVKQLFLDFPFCKFDFSFRSIPSFHFVVGKRLRFKPIPVSCLWFLEESHLPTILLHFKFDFVFCVRLNKLLRVSFTRSFCRIPVGSVWFCLRFYPVKWLFLLFYKTEDGTL